MNLHNVIVTPPLDITSDHVIELNDRQVWFVSTIPWYGEAYSVIASDTPTHRSKVKPSLYIDEITHGVAAHAIEGTPLTVTVKTDVAPVADVSFDWTLTMSNNVNTAVFTDFKATYDNSYAHLNKVAVDADFVALTGTATILAGTNEISFDIDTVDDTLYTSSATYKIAQVEITSTELVSTNRNVSHVLISDAQPTPVIDATIDFEVKVHEYVDFEPLADSDGISQQDVNLGIDTLTGKSNIRTFIIDDIPMISIKALASEDLAAPNAEDITASNFYVQYVIQNGVRT